MPEINESDEHITDTKDILKLLHELECNKSLTEISDRFYLESFCGERTTEKIIEFIGKEYIPDKNKAFSFYYDFPYIFSAFLKEYNINLLTEKLHWKVFVMLFSALGNNNAFAEIIRMRCCEFSSPKERIFQKRFNNKHDKRSELS